MCTRVIAPAVVLTMCKSCFRTVAANIVQQNLSATGAVPVANQPSDVPVRVLQTVTPNKYASPMGYRAVFGHSTLNGVGVWGQKIWKRWASAPWDDGVVMSLRSRVNINVPNLTAVRQTARANIWSSAGKIGLINHAPMTFCSLIRNDFWLV